MAIAKLRDRTAQRLRQAAHLGDVVQVAEALAQMVR